MFKGLFARAVIVALPLAIAACATGPTGPAPRGPQPPVAGGQIFIVSPYHAEDYVWSKAPGANSIRGASPKGYSCAGLFVGLTPEGPYSRERIQKLYGTVTRADRPVSYIRSRSIANDNPDLARFVRSTRCDSEGRFAFESLPDGAYFMIAQVSAADGPLALMRHVMLRGGDMEAVNLTMTVAK